MIALSTNNLTYEIGEKVILTGVTFAAATGDRLGIVGVNGCGKSTLFRLITGAITPESGEIYIAKGATVGIMEQDCAGVFSKRGDETILDFMLSAFQQNLRDEARLSEIENELSSADSALCERLNREYAAIHARFIENGGLYFRAQCKSLLEKLGFDNDSLSRRISSLSGGECSRLNLARLLNISPDILLLDEPTNHLDYDTVAWLEDKLCSYKKTLLVISHDRYFLDNVTNKTLDIENHKAKLYNCPYTRHAEQKKREREVAQKQYAVQQKELARLAAYIKQQRQWNRERNIIAAESREKAIAKMNILERPANAPKAIRFTFDAGSRSGNDVLEAINLSKSFDGSTLFQNVSFEVKKDERLFICGRNGTGKSTLLKILTEQLIPDSGRVKYGYNVSVGYYDQQNQNLSPEKTLIDELWDEYPHIDVKDIRGVLAMFLFRSDEIGKHVASLSGGERARLTLAKLILSPANVLVLDEPTNHLDIPSREALENALCDYDGTIIAVSHDRYFMRRLSTRIIEISDTVSDFRGGFEQYQASKGRKAAPEAESGDTQSAKTDAPAGKDVYLQKKEALALERQRLARLAKIESETAALERELCDICDELEDSGSDYMRAAELDDRRITLEDRLLQLYEEHERLSAQAEKQNNDNKDEYND